jgi:hypothetical protein
MLKTGDTVTLLRDKVAAAGRASTRIGAQTQRPLSKYYRIPGVDSLRLRIQRAMREKGIIGRAAGDADGRKRLRGVDPDSSRPYEGRCAMSGKDRGAKRAQSTQVGALPARWLLMLSRNCG